MKLMLEAILDSFFRAIIRFWDNRFLRKDNPIEIYREEISFLRRRNEELQTFLIARSLPEIKEENEGSNDEMESVGRPIETILQKRRRLERDSLAAWNRSVQEAKDQLAKAKAEGSTKPTEELEKEVLGVIN